MGTRQGRAEMIFSIDNMGLVNIAIQRKPDKNGFDFIMSEKHKLSEFGKLFSIGRALKPGVIMFMCSEKKMFVYDTYLKKILKKIII